ncbi:MAG: hypothetical protein WB615_05940 [Candidatus Tumulicola sp.]
MSHAQPVLAHPHVDKWFLYSGDANGGTKFKVYPLDGSKPVRRFTRPWGIDAMAIDPWSDVYTADGLISGGQIIVYSPGGTSVLLSFLSGPTVALAFDASGNLYESDTAGVEEYAARSTKLLRIFRRNTYGADALAFDSAGNLFVARVGGSIEVFAPGASRPFRAISDGVKVPFALLVSKSDNLFVANCPSCYGSGHFAGSVTEYAPGSGTPLRTLTDGINTPIAMALGRHGLLFVANNPFLKQGSVTVYSSGMTPVRTITNGINGPDSLAIGPGEDLYVANRYAGSITVFSPEGSCLLRTITQGVQGPTAIAIGKN